jgi:hypothetical protein
MGDYESEILSNLERAETNLQVEENCWKEVIMMSRPHALITPPSMQPAPSC